MQALAGIFVLLLIFAIPLLGVGMRMFLRLAYGARGPAPDSILYGVVNVIAWFFILGWIPMLVMVATLVMIVGESSPVVLGALVFLPVLMAIVLGGVLEYVLSQRALQRDSLWNLITRATSRGQNIGRLVETQRDRFWGVVRRDLEGFLWQTQRGEPLPTAIDVWRKAFPRQALGYAALSKNGELMHDAADSRSNSAAGRENFLFQFAYLVALLAVLLLIVSGVMLFIVPVFERIFADFDLDLALLTTSFISLSEICVKTFLAPLLAMLIGLTLLGSFVIAIFYLLDKPVLRPLGDRLSFASHRAAVLRLLAVATEHGMPFEKALANLAAGSPRYPARVAATRLHRAMRHAAQGANWKDSLARAGILHNSEVALLSASESAMNLPWALRALSDRIVARSWFRWEAIFQMAYPLLLLLIGLFIAWFCVAMFLPLVNLISCLA
ncbi:MAG: type II secretion system F family protein [Planctomycetales bacterium]|nr:type II secretion system F family protein [Planctomycetales bacterium]